MHVELSNKATRAEVKASPGKKCFGNLLANQEDEGSPGGRAWQEGRPNQVCPLNKRGQMATVKRLSWNFQRYISRQPKLLVVEQLLPALVVVRMYL